MFTGQISSHALHVVHAHSSSDVMRSNTESASIGDVAVDADRRRDRRVAGRGHHLADLQHDLARVERLAGRVRRAHRGAATADRARVGVEELLPGEVLDGRRAERLELGLHQVRHAASSRPWAGPCRARYMFIGDVIMCRSFVVGRITRNATNAAKCTTHIAAVQVASVAVRPASRTSSTSG